MGEFSIMNPVDMAQDVRKLPLGSIAHQVMCDVDFKHFFDQCWRSGCWIVIGCDWYDDTVYMHI